MPRYCFKVKNAKEVIKKLDTISWKFTKSPFYPYEYSGYYPIFDEAGFQYNVPYLVKAFKNSICIYLNKRDIPSWARWMAEDILDGIYYEVCSYLGIKP